MFVDSALTAGIGFPPSATEKQNGVTLGEKILFVMNAIIDQHGHVEVAVIRKGNKPCPKHTVRTSVKFTGKTAFLGDSESWFLVFEQKEINLTCSPMHPTGFVEWIEESFERLQSSSKEKLAQPSTKFSQM